MTRTTNYADAGRRGYGVKENQQKKNTALLIHCASI